MLLVKAPAKLVKENSQFRAGFHPLANDGIHCIELSRATGQAVASHSNICVAVVESRGVWRRL